jgi:hypothetical protein
MVTQCLPLPRWLGSRCGLNNIAQAHSQQLFLWLYEFSVGQERIFSRMKHKRLQSSMCMLLWAYVCSSHAHMTVHTSLFLLFDSSREDEILTSSAKAVLPVMSTVFWDITPCSLVKLIFYQSTDNTLHYHRVKTSISAPCRNRKRSKSLRFPVPFQSRESKHRLHADLGISSVQDVIQQRSNKHHNKIKTHENPLLKTLLAKDDNRRLKRNWPIDLI